MTKIPFALVSLLALAGCAPGSGGGTGGAGSGGRGGSQSTGVSGAGGAGQAGSVGAGGDGTTGVAGDGGPGVAGAGGAAGASGVAGASGEAGAAGSGSGTAGRGGAGGGSTGGMQTTGCPAGGAAGTTPPACTSNPADYQFPFQDPCRPIEDRITNLLSQMTAAEKLTLMNEYQPSITRLNVPGFTTFTEGLHGVGWASAGTPDSVLYLTGTQFPQTSGLAESWDPAVWQTVGATTGYEARVWNAMRGVNAMGRGVGVTVRAPLVDLGRDPRWGRTEESPGEDPYLAAELAKGYLAGLHGTDPKYLLAASTLKHWLANNNEAMRNTTSATFDDRNLREYYAYPFQEAIQKGRAQGIMTAYNKVNNVPAAVSPLVKSLIIGQWGFDGLVCTDAWTANSLVNDQHYYTTLEDAVGGIVKSGTGVIVQEGIQPTVAAAYNASKFTQADMDAVLRPLLRVRFRVGDLDPASFVPYKRILGTETPWTTAEYKQRALDVTRKTVVLLKNASNTLPLNRTALPNGVAIIGPRADSVLRDWYGGLAPYKVTARQGITTKLGSGVTVRYAADNTGNAATTAAMQSSVAIVFVGNHPTCGTAPPDANPTPWGTCPTTYEGREAVDRVNIGLDPTQQALVQSVYAANPRTIVVLVSSFPQGVAWLEQNVPAIVHIANSGQELGTAIADVLFGDYNPAGRTAMTWYTSETQIPTAITDYDIRKGKTYQYFTGTPLYSFGHGLSYTSFAYSNLSLSGPMVTLANCGRVTVSVDVQNTGTRAGDEVVQLYVAYPASTSLPRPRQQLRGFKRIALAAGAMQRVSFELAGSALTYWDAAGARFAVQSGAVEVQVGASSKDIRLKASLNVAP